MCGLLVDQPEAYENPMFVAALDSVTSGQLTTDQAAEKFAIRESALIAAVSWSDAAPASGALTASTTGSMKVLCCQHTRAFTRATLASAPISCHVCLSVRPSVTSRCCCHPATDWRGTMWRHDAVR